MIDKPLDDPKRLAAIAGTGLAGSGPEDAFDQLTRMAARLLDAPAAFVSLVGSDRQFLTSCFGTVPEPYASRRELPLSHSFCQHVVTRQAPLIVEDTRQHPLTQDSPAIGELGVIAYAGMPLVDPAGEVLGTLCVIDGKPRKWTEEQIENLRSLAATVMSTIAYRLRANASEQAAHGRGGAREPTEGHAAAAMAAFLAGDISRHLDALDAYQEFVNAADPSPPGLRREAELQGAVVETNKRLEGSLGELERALQASDGDPTDAGAERRLQEACRAYLEAERGRAEAVARFQVMEVELAAVERAVARTRAAEQELRRVSEAFSAPDE